jgi:hypothetical protein
MAASCELVNDLRESSDFLLLAQRRAGTVPIFDKFRYIRFRFHFLFTLHFLPCFFFSTSSILAMVLSCRIVLGPSFPCLLVYVLQANLNSSRGPRSSILLAWHFLALHFYSPM